MIKTLVLNIKLWPRLNDLVNKFRNLHFRMKLAFILALFLAVSIGIFGSLFFFHSSKPLPKPLMQTGPALPLSIQKPEPTHIERIERAASAEEAVQAKYEELMLRLQQEGTAQDPAHLQSAIKTLKQLLVQAPHYAPAREALAALLIKQGNLAAAQQLVEKGLVQQPTYLPYLKLKLHILVKEGNIEQALVLLRDFPSGVLEGDADYIPLLAQIYLQQGQYEQAVQAYQGLLKADPDNAAWAMGLGLALEGLGKSQEALQAYLLARRIQALQ